MYNEDPFTPLEESLEAMNWLLQTGKARYIGFSNWYAWKSAVAYQMQKDN
jgi:aryl-alcohol dehydrogenase-like predicted oxidoreductase